MDDVGDLHAAHAGQVEREHQHIAAQRHRQTAQHHRPEDHLLPGVEAAGFRVEAVAQEAAALFDPAWSAFSGILSRTHSTSIITMPSTNGKLRKLWAIFP